MDILFWIIHNRYEVNMKMRKISAIILIIFLPLFILLKTIEVNTFNKGFYLKSYEKYGVLEVTGRNIDELDRVTIKLLEYIKDESGEEVLKPFFNEREIKHMEDVKILFKYGFNLKKISFVLTLFGIIFLINQNVPRLGRIIFYGPFIWWGAILMLFLLSTMNFNRYFTYFHLIFFDNDLWILNPDTDLLIQMLPEEFFISIFKRIVLSFIIIMSIIQLIGNMLMKKGRDKNEGITDF